MRPRVQLFEHAVLRVAAWPIETVDQFAAPDLVEAARAVLAAQERVADHRATALPMLHSAVRLAPERDVRRYLLSVKRKIYSGMEPLPQPSPSVQAHLAASGWLQPVLSESTRLRLELHESRARFEHLYATEMQRQRRVLCRKTNSHQFHRALVIANPVVAVRWEIHCRQLLEVEEQAIGEANENSRGAVVDPSTAPQGASAGRSRRLEAAVFHYLMRAIGRATPCGAWAGVVPVSLDSSDTEAKPTLSVDAAESRYDVNVDLRPFQIMLQALARTQRYRRECPLRLNPTLFECRPEYDRHDTKGRSTSTAEPEVVSRDGWRYERQHQGTANWVTLPFHPLPAAIIRFYEDHVSRPTGPLLAALRSSTDSLAETEAMERLIDTLIDWDVLRVDLSLPSRASSVWQVLDPVVMGLLEPERTSWREGVARLKRLCTQLAAAFDQLSPAEVDQHLRDIVAEIQILWEEVGIAGDIPTPAVHLDMRLPFGARWNTSFMALAERTVNNLLEFHARDGGAELYRRQSLDDIVAACAGTAEVPVFSLLADGGLNWHVGPGPKVAAHETEPTDWPRTRESIFSRTSAVTPIGEQAGTYCRRWENLLEPVHHLAVHRLPIPPVNDHSLEDAVASPEQAALPGPYGSILLQSTGGEGMWLGPARPEPGLHVARFGKLLREADGDEEGPLFSLLRNSVASATTTARLVEVVGDDALNLSVNVYPHLTDSTIESHGPPDRGLQDVTLLLDPREARPWLRRNPEPELLVPICNSGAHMGFTDRCSRLLLTIARGHGWEFLSFGFPPSRAELARWHHLPRLLLPQGEVLSPQRWTLPRETVSALAAQRGPAQYLRWREKVERLGLPALVLAQCGPVASELLLRTDSPLAVSSLFDTIGKNAPWIMLSELAGSPQCWPIQDSAGNHYLSELALIWFARDYWNAVTQHEAACRGQA